MAGHVVDLAVERLQEDRFGVLDLIPGDAIEIGELLAFLVDLPVIGIALGDHPLARSVGRGQVPGMKRRCQ